MKILTGIENLKLTGLVSAGFKNAFASKIDAGIMSDTLAGALMTSCTNRKDSK